MTELLEPMNDIKFSPPEVLKEFIDSGMAIAKLNLALVKYSNVDALAAALRVAIKYHDYKGIVVVKNRMQIVLKNGNVKKDNSKLFKEL